jgi:uncharacterized damage-inducible protein DinB
MGINNRFNPYLLDAIPPEALGSLPPSARTRTVARIFVHRHHVCLSRLEATPPALLGHIEKFDQSEKLPDKQRLRQALEQSGEAMAQFIGISVEKGKIKDYQLPPIGFLGYLISHEAYHRGEICVALTESGHKLDDAILYSHWDWSKR